MEAPKAKKRGPGQRLTAAAKLGIKTSPPEVSATELAKRFNTTPQTIARYRNAKKAPALKAAAEKSKITRVSDEVALKMISNALSLDVPANLRLDVIAALAARR